MHGAVAGQPLQGVRIRPVLCAHRGRARLHHLRDVIPYPAGDGFWLPIAAGVWVAIALAPVVFMPGLVSRIGQELAGEQGLQVAGRAQPAAEQG